MITSASAGSGVIGSAFSHQVTASNSPTSYAASGLPSGLGINSSSGLISGTISSSATAGVYSVTIVATNAGGSGTQTFALTLTSPLPSAPVISSSAAASGVSGSSFSYQIAATNSPTSYNASGFPSGLSINTSSGLISGTISSSVTAGIYYLSRCPHQRGRLRHEDSFAHRHGAASSGSGYHKRIHGSRRLGCEFQLPGGCQRILPASFAATGLPTGMSINSSTGVISGATPVSLATGNYLVTLTATNSGGSGTQLLTLEIEVGLRCLGAG
ncbi:MAG: Ig domain-containing protein [Nibricoccus sp.]